MTWVGLLLKICGDHAQREDFFPAGMRRCLLSLLHLLLQLPNGDCVREGGGEGDGSCGAKERPPPFLAFPAWQQQLAAVLAQLEQWWALGEQAAGRGRAVPSAVAERNMVDVACFAVAMLLSISPTVFSAISSPSPASEDAKGNGNKEALPPPLLPSIASLPDSLHAMLHQSGLLSRLREWIRGSPPRLHQVMDSLLGHCLAIHQAQHASLSNRPSGGDVKEASRGGRQIRGPPVLPKEVERRGGISSAGEASFPPFLAHLFASPLVSHHPEVLQCMACFMRWVTPFSPPSPSSAAEGHTRLAVEGNRGSLPNPLSTTFPSSREAKVVATEDTSRPPKRPSPPHLHEEAAAAHPGCHRFPAAWEAVPVQGGKRGREEGWPPTSIRKTRGSSPSLWTWQRWASLLLLLTRDEGSSAHGAPWRQAGTEAEKGNPPSGSRHHASLSIAYGASIVVASGSDPLAALSFLSPSSSSSSTS